ncbi:Sister chromatid cohesion protein Eso1 [Pleurostoma richardsiae]|uniref:DNA polymerase eta n=1 Tax=Pleurostoma richardsiae TaxID=41990 RepID=A0AA38S978_9PEZI|nr:Sister chromatid cohesion protein Eso1 [Pleurostoma richardsiae]
MSSSPQGFQGSSPVGPSGYRRSKFTYRNLSQMASYATSSPLRVIAHIDLDAFYAQCEMVRLGVAEDQPLAVQQWQGLIAINYPARKFGIGRMCTVADAKKLCPELICQHVATWREGDEKWAYHDDAAANIATHKVSLDPYRLQSRRILALIKEILPSDLQKVEKASIDEVFLDLSAHVHSLLLERFPELCNPPPYDDPTERLPLPPVSALDWQTDALVDLEDVEAETEDPDWDDIAMLIGSEIVRGVRTAVREKLHYTCSAGIANNKMLSKLGSGHKKPNQQTVIRNRAVHQFLSGFKYTKIRMLGGKLGDQIAEIFGSDTVSDLLLVPVEQLKSKLGDDTGIWVYNTIRGIDPSEVSSRTQIKSMLSAKSFRPSINTIEQAVKWLRIFVADIFSRLVEEGVLENKRRPKTITLHHRHGGQTRSRQTPIPQGRSIDEDLLFGLAKNLLNQIVLEGKVWPCANLSLNVGGFEDGVTGNMGIGAFLVKGDEAQALKLGIREDLEPSSSSRPAGKKRRLEDEGIGRFFSKKEPSTDGYDRRSLSDQTARSDSCGDKSPNFDQPPASDVQVDREGLDAISRKLPHAVGHEQKAITDYICPRCNVGINEPDAVQSHQDWHLAKDLQDEERVGATFASRQSPASSGRNSGKNTATSSKRAGKAKTLEAGQSRLKFA